MEYESDQRKWTRMPSESETVIVESDQVRESAVVIEFGFGGISVRVPSSSELEPDVKIRVHWKGGWMNGVVRHITPLDNEMRIGIEWASYAAKKEAIAAEG